LPQARFNFIELGKLSEVEKDATVGTTQVLTNLIADVVGVLKDVGEPSEITSKTTQKAVSLPNDKS
jgi:replication factor A1